MFLEERSQSYLHLIEMSRVQIDATSRAHLSAIFVPARSNELAGRRKLEQMQD